MSSSGNRYNALVSEKVEPKSWANIVTSAPVTKIKDIVNELAVNTKSNGSEYILPSSYTLWYHSLTDNNWKIDSFQKMCTIYNISDFWRMINNFDKIGYKNRDLFLMKSDIEPMWEHVENRNGGICSFRVEMHNSLEIYENLCAYMVLESLSDIPNDINGISFSPKRNLAFVKIWNKNRDNDLSKTLNKDILKKYGDLSIKYRPNNPEF